MKLTNLYKIEDQKDETFPWDIPEKCFLQIILNPEKRPKETQD